MKQTKYPVRVQDSDMNDTIEWHDNGWEFPSPKGYEFMKLVVHRDVSPWRYGWTVTEANTGCTIGPCGYKTRKEAVALITIAIPRIFDMEFVKILIENESIT